jgi:hypothetical protein
VSDRVGNNEDQIDNGTRFSVPHSQETCIFVNWVRSSPLVSKTNGIPYFRCCRQLATHMSTVLDIANYAQPYALGRHRKLCES